MHASKIHSAQEHNKPPDLHKSKKFLFNANNNSHSFQVGSKVVSLNNLNSIATSPAAIRKPYQKTGKLSIHHTKERLTAMAA